MSDQEETRDPRVQRTTQLVQQAFVELLHQKRFETITVKDISKQAGVNRATFYAHFADKYALLDATISSIFQQLLLKRLPTHAMTHFADFESVVLAVCDFLCQFDGACRLMQRHFEVLVEQEIKKHVTDLIQRWLMTTEKRHDPNDLTVEQAAIMASWSIYGASLHWSRQQPRPSPHVLAKQVLRLLADGLCGYGD